MSYTCSYTSVGEQTVEMVVRDTDGQRLDFLTRDGRVTIVDVLQSVSIILDCDDCKLDDAVDMFGGVTQDDEVGVVSYTWDFGDDTPEEVYPGVVASGPQGLFVHLNHT